MVDVYFDWVEYGPAGLKLGDAYVTCDCGHEWEDCYDPHDIVKCPKCGAKYKIRDKYIWLERI